jgi:hypothetical protein
VDRRGLLRGTKNSNKPNGRLIEVGPKVSGLAGGKMETEDVGTVPDLNGVALKASNSRGGQFASAPRDIDLEPAARA